MGMDPNQRGTLAQEKTPGSILSGAKANFNHGELRINSLPMHQRGIQSNPSLTFAQRKVSIKRPPDAHSAIEADTEEYIFVFRAGIAN